MGQGGSKIRRRALGTAVIGLAVGAGSGCRSRLAIPADAAEQLRAVAEAFIGLVIEPSHYEQYFRARLARDARARRRYQQVLGLLAHGRPGEAGFAERAAPDRRRVLELLERQVGPEERATLRAVRRESLALFSRTDAWIHLGYDSWPGTARGFEGLDVPPARARPPR